jgi:hypothetical protein
MKQILLSFCLLATLCASASQGGPDAFGYTWKDSNEPGGPTYAWKEISTIGNPVNGLGDDNFVGPFQIGFQFPFYWYTESKVWIGTNGYIEFDPGNLAANFPAIPNPTGVNNYIGGIISDMTFLGSGNPGRIYTWANQDSFIVEYQNVPYWDASAAGYNVNSSNTFQIVLCKADSSITVNFQSYSGFSISNYTTGIENNIGNMGLQPLSSQPPQQAYSIRYYFPANALQITDAGVDWNDNSGNAGIFLANMGDPYPLVTQVSNHGNQSIGPVSVYSQVNTLNNTALVGNSDVTGPLVPSQSWMITFANAFAPTTVGTRKAFTQISGPAGDTILVNDSIVQEIVVVDTTQPVIRLCYTDNHANPVLNSISWNGGNGGVGMYFQPPTYPARIVSTNFVIMSTPGSGIAFYAKIYDDDGPANSPGTLLDSVAVMANQITPGGVSTIPVGSSVIISSGGFYVNWDMGTTAVSIGEDRTPPFSRRSYETFQGIWSTYRDYQVADFFIGADYAVAEPEDVGVSSITSPANNSTVTGSSTVSCYITNYGDAADNYSIEVNFKLASDPMIVTQQYTGPPILPGDSVLFTFTQQLIVPASGNDVLSAWTSKVADIDHNNDTSAVNLTLVGVEELQPLEGISVYPVPAQEKITFAFETATDDAVVISITDISGKVIDVKKAGRAAAGTTITVDLDAYSPGTYFYTITSGTRQGNGKLIKIN